MKTYKFDEVDLVAKTEEGLFVFQKDNDIVGSLMAALQITDLGIKGIYSSLSHFKNHEDKIRVLEGFIKDLAEIHHQLLSDNEKNTK